MSRQSSLQLLVCVVGVLTGASLRAQRNAPRSNAISDSVSIRVQNVDLRSAVQVMGQYLDQPIIFSGPGNAIVTLQTPRPVPRQDVIRLLRGLLESQNYELVADTASRLFRARPTETPPPTPASLGLGGSRTPSPPPRQPGAVELFVIAIKHARAADVAATINALYGRRTLPAEPYGRTPTLGDELRGMQVPPVEAPLPQSIPGIAGRSAALTGELTIVAESRANSLLIRANRTDFELVQAIVQQLDIRPLQVLIEVIIAEVRRDRSFNLGIEAHLDTTTVGHHGGRIAGEAGNPSTGDIALEVLGIGGFRLDARITAAAERGDARILSRPEVIAANNELATIVVGSQRPFIQVSRSLPTDLAVRDQVVQYKDVGTKLTVRPTISSDGSVQLEVTQEVSNATTETQFNAPVISTRSVQTQLLVQDGQTVALGGLTDREKDVSQGGVPFFSSIPLVGGLFGHVSRDSNETELYVFLTPRVIRNDEDARRLSDPLRKRAEENKP